jgi:hypothetical protein
MQVSTIMIIKYEYQYTQLFKMWRKQKEAVDWLIANVADKPTYYTFSETNGYKHAVGQTQEEADNIWQDALLNFSLITGLNDADVVSIKIHQTNSWAVYGATIADDAVSISRYFVFIVLPDDVTAIQCKLALS